MRTWLQSADPTGLRVDPLSFPPILRTLHLSNLILPTLRAGGEKITSPPPLPPPWPGLGNPRMVPDVPADLFLICLVLGTIFRAITYH